MTVFVPVLKKAVNTVTPEQCLERFSMYRQQNTLKEVSPLRGDLKNLKEPVIFNTAFCYNIICFLSGPQATNF